MNSALLYRQRGRWIFWVALVSAVAIHIAAVAVAKTKSPAATSEHFTPIGSVDILDALEPEPVSLEESAMPSPVEKIVPGQEIFPDENSSNRPVRVHQRARPVSLSRAATTTSFRSVKPTVVYAPRPFYPYEARRQRMTGSGVALLTIDRASGAVIDVVMTQTCGNAILDNSTLDALRRWRFKPGNVTSVQVPITYTLMGTSY